MNRKSCNNFEIIYCGRVFGSYYMCTWSVVEADAKPLTLHHCKFMAPEDNSYTRSGRSAHVCTFKIKIRNTGCTTIPSNYSSARRPERGCCAFDVDTWINYYYQNRTPVTPGGGSNGLLDGSTRKLKVAAFAFVLCFSLPVNISMFTLKIWKSISVCSC